MAWIKDAPSVVTFNDDESGYSLTCTNVGAVGGTGPFDCVLRNSAGQGVGSIQVPDLVFLDRLFTEVSEEI